MSPQVREQKLGDRYFQQPLIDHSFMDLFVLQKHPVEFNGQEILRIQSDCGNANLNVIRTQWSEPRLVQRQSDINCFREASDVDFCHLTTAFDPADRKFPKRGFATIGGSGCVSIKLCFKPGLISESPWAKYICGQWIVQCHLRCRATAFHHSPIFDICRMIFWIPWM